MKMISGTDGEPRQNDGEECSFWLFVAMVQPLQGRHSLDVSMFSSSWLHCMYAYPGSLPPAVQAFAWDSMLHDGPRPSFGWRWLYCRSSRATYPSSQRRRPSWPCARLRHPKWSHSRPSRKLTGKPEYLGMAPTEPGRSVKTTVTPGPTEGREGVALLKSDPWRPVSPCGAASRPVDEGCARCSKNVNGS